jgi:Mycobacterium membrane protein
MKGSRLQQVSISRRLGRRWMVLVATATYTDVDAQPQRADAVELPWAYDTTTTQPAVFVNVSAQGDSDSIGCRIKIDDAVKDERSVDTLNAFTYCLDKSG